jgi:ABC-type hemin transport system ATPase subunit
MATERQESNVRLTEVRINDAPPVRKFDVTGLGEIVVLAGPNGVGKTRLITHLINYLRSPGPQWNTRAIIEATTPTEAKAWGDARSLDLGDQQQAHLFTQTLQQGKRRRKFESDRTVSP